MFRLPQRVSPSVLQQQQQCLDDPENGPSSSSSSWSRRGFRLTLVSNGLFFIASALYVYLSIIKYEYEREVEHYPQEVLDADDAATWYEWGYEDDYVDLGALAKPNAYISKYTVVYFSAALGFVIAGLVDFYLWRSLFSVIMMMAASFGLAAATYADRDPSLSGKLSAVSVHLWLLEAFTVMLSRNNAMFGKHLTIWLRVADVSFVIATFIDVVFSWTYVLNEPVRVGIPQAIIEIVAACLWLLTATIYVSSVVILGRRQQQQELVERSTNSIDTSTSPAKPFAETEVGSQDESDCSSPVKVVVTDTENGTDNIEIH